MSMKISSMSSLGEKKKKIIELKINNKFSKTLHKFDGKPLNKS